MSISRERLIETLETLAGEARAGSPEQWENDTLPAYFEALAAWLRVYEQSFINTGRAVPTDPWEVLAVAVRAATVYE